MSPLGVLMLTRELNFGGIERDVSKFARHLGAFGIQPHVACFNPGGVRWKEIEAAGIPTLYVPLKSFKSWSQISSASRLLRTYIRQHNLRILHAFDVPAGVYGIPFARLIGLPCLSSQLCYRELLLQPTRSIIPVIDFLSTRVFVNCRAIENHMADDWHVSRSRICVCHNGVETSEFNPHNRTRVESLKTADLVIGSVGVLREEKNFPLLVDAFAAVHREFPGARLALVGDGPMLGPLEEQARRRGVREACLFHAAVQQPAGWMRSIDIFVLPSRSEAFSNALLEAMACGCCPVASRVGGTPELVKDGETGLLFESGDVRALTEHLLTLARDHAQRVRLGAAAARWAAQEHSIEAMSQRLAGIYRSLAPAT